MAPQSKYTSEAERREAHRQQSIKYWATHRKECLERHRRYNETHKGEILTKNRLAYRKRRYHFHAERLAEADRVEISKLESENDFVKSEMTKQIPNPHHQQFIEFCKNNDMTQDSNIEEAYSLVKRSICFDNTSRGFMFEKVVKKLMLNKFEDTQFKVYSQVPYDALNDNYNYCRRIDFVVSTEDTDKDKLDLSKAVIVSCKTGIGTNFHEDERLYADCKAYIMITLGQKLPQSELPDNVFFCVPDKDFDDHIINMDYFTDFIIQTLTDHN